MSVRGELACPPKEGDHERVNLAYVASYQAQSNETFSRISSEPKVHQTLQDYPLRSELLPNGWIEINFNCKLRPAERWVGIIFLYHALYKPICQ